MNITIIDVDRAIKKFIESLNLVDRQGNIIPVSINKADILTNSEVYPKITFNMYDMKLSKTKKDYNSYTVENLGESKANVVDSPNYYDLYYQIDLWSDSQLDNSTLNYDWVSNNPDLITPITISNIEGDYPTLLVQQDIKDLDTLNTSQDKLIHHKIYSYKLSIPMKPKKVVRAVVEEISVNNTNRR